MRSEILHFQLVPRGGGQCSWSMASGGMAPKTPGLGADGWKVYKILVKAVSKANSVWPG